jgi:hypothetical protein
MPSAISARRISHRRLALRSSQYGIVAAVLSCGEDQVHSRAPVLLRFSVRPPSTTPTGRWRRAAVEAELNGSPAAHGSGGVVPGIRAVPEAGETQISACNLQPPFR